MDGIVILKICSTKDVWHQIETLEQLDHLVHCEGDSHEGMFNTLKIPQQQQA